MKFKAYCDECGEFFIAECYNSPTALSAPLHIYTVLIPETWHECRKGADLYTLEQYPPYLVIYYSPTNKKFSAYIVYEGKNYIDSTLSSTNIKERMQKFIEKY